METRRAQLRHGWGERLGAALCVAACLAAYTLGPWVSGDWALGNDGLFWIWAATLPALWIICLAMGLYFWRTEGRAAWGFGLIWGSILFYVPFWYWIAFVVLPRALADG